MVDFIYYTPRWPLTIGLLLTTLLTLELGYRIGRQWAFTNPEYDDAFRGASAAVHSLMAFLLAFSFSFAASRFESRRDVMEKEATAIGTAYLRATLMTGENGQRLVSLFEPYVKARIALYQGDADEALPEWWQASRQIQGNMWTLAGACAQADPANRRVDMLLASLNAMFDAGDDQVDARMSRLPSVVYLVLFTAVLGSATLMGYGFGRARKRSVLAWGVFVVLTSLVIYLVLDLDRPKRGFITTSLRPLEIVQQSFQ